MELTDCVACFHGPSAHSARLVSDTALVSGPCKLKGCKCKGYVIMTDFVSAYPDQINHPAHYTDGKIEVWDYIDDKALGYFKGNAVKYISRAGKKNPDKEIEDLEKAIAYLNREIKRIKESPRNPGQTPLDYAGHTSIQGDN